MGNGSGTEADPHLIEDFADFNAFASDPNYWAGGVCTQLTVDIDLDPNLPGRQVYTKAVIAPHKSKADMFQATPFMGVFDGNYHKINNLIIDTAGANNYYLGLFGQIEGKQAQVRNLGIEDFCVAGGDRSHFLGGLCGKNLRGKISRCCAIGSVTGGSGQSFYVGGLCGWNYGTISSCYAVASVSGGHSYIGGLCGRSMGTISNCYTIGFVTGGDSSSRVGGLCGGSYMGTISNCYAAASVTGGAQYYSNTIGGLCGQSSTHIYHSFWDTQTSGIASSAGGMNKTTAEMMDMNTYKGWPNNIWTIDNGDDYPHLAWENQTGTAITNTPPTYGGGSGEPNDPYLIAEPDDLIELGFYPADWDKHFKLLNDIDLSPFVFNEHIIPEFRGVFDGDGHSISDLTIDTDGAERDFLGLFGQIKGNQALVKNLGLESVYIAGGNGSRYLGALCGRNWDGTVSNCYADSSVGVEDYPIDLAGDNCGQK